MILIAEHVLNCLPEPCHDKQHQISTLLAAWLVLWLCLLGIDSLETQVLFLAELHFHSFLSCCYLCSQSTCNILLYTVHVQKFQFPIFKNLQLANGTGFPDRWHWNGMFFQFFMYEATQIFETFFPNFHSI